MALTRTTQQQEELSVPMPFSDALKAVVTAFQKIGRVQSVQEKFGRVVGSIGSGMLNMNKADVTVQVESDGDTKSKIKFTATAQEGLISQNTAAKAVTRILDAMQ